MSLKFSTVSLYIQFRHHTEHAVLQYQAITGHYWFHSPVPVSFLQAAGIPRIELHLFYNTIVFISMVTGMHYHMFSHGKRRNMQSAPARGIPASSRALPPHKRGRLVVVVDLIMADGGSLSQR